MSDPIGPVEEQYALVHGSGPEPLNVSEYEVYARNHLPRNAFDYYASGANDMITLRENRSAYTKLRIIPRLPKDVSQINMETTILGEKIPFPICVAPTAMQRMAHPEGEVATAKASSRHGTLMTLSSLSTTSLEEVARNCKGPKWFQLYVYTDKKVTLDLVKRAERAGYTALAVTVDTPILGRREADLRNRFALPPHLKMANFENVGGDHESGTKTSGATGSGLATYMSNLINRAFTWKDVKWLMSVTILKIVVKGIQSVEDALEAVKCGIDGIWVSNHGARQLDTAPATIDILPHIAEAVGDSLEIYVDGGIMRGTDVLKAIALGARAVFVGRPILWGLAHSGEQGVYNVLKLLKEELWLAMMLSGCVDLNEVRNATITTPETLRSRL